jgi:hypothetical protein
MRARLTCFDIALNAVDLGLSTIPPKEDGTKAPLAEWKPYQHAAPSRQLVENWYASGRSGVGLVTGYAALECFEFDCGVTYRLFLEIATATGLGDLVAKIRAGYEERTPGGGYHWLYYCDELRSNNKLAERPDPSDPQKREVLIETRGQGGFVIIAPSNGKVHPSGGAYELLTGGLESIVTLTPEEREQLWNLARTFGEMPVDFAAQDPTPKDAGLRPGDDYNERANWEEILVGWTVHHIRGDVTYWCRPSKDKAEGWSATTGHCKGLYVFTTSTPFDAEKSYSKFAAYTWLNHKRNFSEAAQALAAVGYGTQPENDNEPPIVLPSWPAPLADDAYYGLAGEIVRGIAPHTEADPVAMLIHLLIGYGNIVGRSTYLKVGRTFHHTNEFALVIGDTSIGRKGTARDESIPIVESVDPSWHVACGLSSGEGVIYAIRDQTSKSEPVKERGTGKILGYQDVIDDQGVSDKRLMVIETEFGRVLKAMQRDHSTLSAILRQAWDGHLLRSLVKGSPYQASGAHVSCVAHITPGELRNLLTGTDLSNGFANRYLWIACRRTQLLPFGGRVAPETLAEYQTRLLAAVEHARKTEWVWWTPVAQQIWKSAYPSLTEQRPGAIGHVVDRAAPHVLRLAMIYALLDLRNMIEPEHLQAALAIVAYSERSAKYILGDRLGDKDEEAILSHIRTQSAGATRTGINRAVFGGHKPPEFITLKLTSLLAKWLIRREIQATDGRDREVWFPATPIAH